MDSRGQLIGTGFVSWNTGHYFDFQAWILVARSFDSIEENWKKTDVNRKESVVPARCRLYALDLAAL